MHLFATTMLRPALHITRSAVRPLANPRHSQKLTLPNARSLHQHLPTCPTLVSQNLVSAASIFGSGPRFSIREGIEGLQTRSLTSTSRNSARYLRSDDRRRKAADKRPLVSNIDDDLPGKDRKAYLLLPFRAASFADALTTTIVGVGMSESCKLRACRIEMKLNECLCSFHCRGCIPEVVQMEGSRQGMLHTRPSRNTRAKTILLSSDGGCLQCRI